MDNYALVRPEHLNHHGYLFGGMLLKWVDEYAWMAASLDFPRRNFVTIGLNNIIFKKRIKNGGILRFNIDLLKKGNTSVTYKVNVFADEPGATEETEVFVTEITFVNIGKNGKPTSV
jgi:acyl-CoA hydrolase